MKFETDTLIKKGKTLNKTSGISEELFGRVWEISVDGMRIIDEKGNIIMVNEQYCKMVNMSRQKLEGKPFSIVYHPSGRNDALKIYQQDVKDNKVKTHFERERKLWNGKKLWFEFSNSFLEMPDNKKITLSIIKNITARKNAELELKESEKRYKMLFNSANDGVFVIQLMKGKSYGDFIEVNDAACQRLGYEREEFLKLSPSAIIPPKFINEYSRVMENLLSDKHIIFELAHITKDKRIIPVEISAHLFEYNKESTVLSIVRDITERKQTEGRLRRTSKRLRNLASHLQSIREEERSSIAREIHDELGQVLTVLKIQMSLLSKKLNDDQEHLKSKFNEMLGIIDQSVESVQKICSKLRPEILDELGLVPAIEWQTQEFERVTGIECIINLTDEELTIDTEKSTAIFRIYQEALTNVIRHSGATRITISLSLRGNMLVLGVNDNGAGVTEEQVSAPKSLGILGMRERALVFGGTVQIDGIAGQGTEVKVEIPLDN